jgi:hypothetical protein
VTDIAPRFWKRYLLLGGRYNYLSAIEKDVKGFVSKCIGTQFLRHVMEEPLNRKLKTSRSNFENAENRTKEGGELQHPTSTVR